MYMSLLSFSMERIVDQLRLNEENSTTEKLHSINLIRYEREKGKDGNGTLKMYSHSSL